MQQANLIHDRFGLAALANASVDDEHKRRVRARVNTLLL